MNNKRIEFNKQFTISRKGIYESLAKFKKLPSFKVITQTGRSWEYTKTYSPVMDRLLLDIDVEKDLEKDLEKAFTVTKQIMQELDDYKDCINVYFSGSKGFHVEILTEDLDIIDINADKPMDSCLVYEEFLNYFSNKYEGVDTSLKDVGTRVIRKHNFKHPKSGNYKILVNLEDNLQSIISHSEANEDMVEPASNRLNEAKRRYLIRTYRKPIKRDKTSISSKENTPNEDMSIFSKVFKDLTSVGTTEEKHKAIGLLGSALNGYVSSSELEEIYQELHKNTNISESANAKQSLFDAFESDQRPYNMGQLHNQYKNSGLDFTNFNALSRYLEEKQINKSYDKFTKIMQSYDNDLFKIFETELYDYVDNTENIIKGVINALSALFGYGSRFIIVNGGAEVGKSEYVNTIKKLMPNFENLGSSTPASIRRQKPLYYDKKNCLFRR